MLAGNGGRPKLPYDFSGFARNTNHRGGRPIAGKDVAVRQLLDAIALSPQRARRLHLGDAIRDGIKMFPGAPFPNRVSRRSDLSQIIGVHLVGFGDRSGSILARLHVPFRHPSFDAPRDFFGYLAHAMQQHVPVAQQDAVVVMVGMAHLPQYLPIPVRFQDHAAFEWKTTEKALLRSASVEKQGPALVDVAGQAGRIWHVPGVDDLALKVDEIHGPAFHEMRGKKREPRERALRLPRTQANASTFEVFCSNSGIAWLPPMATLAPMAAEPMSSMRRCMDQYSWLSVGRLHSYFCNPQAARCDSPLWNRLALQASHLSVGAIRNASVPLQLVGVAAAIEIKRIVEMPLATNCFVIVVALRGGEPLESFRDRLEPR